MRQHYAEALPHLARLYQKLIFQKTAGVFRDIGSLRAGVSGGTERLSREAVSVQTAVGRANRAGGRPTAHVRASNDRVDVEGGLTADAAACPECLFNYQRLCWRLCADPACWAVSSSLLVWEIGTAD